MSEKRNKSKSLHKKPTFTSNILFDSHPNNNFNISKTFAQNLASGFHQWNFSSPSDFIEGRSSDQIFSCLTLSANKIASCHITAKHYEISSATSDTKVLENIKSQEHLSLYSSSALAHFSIFEVDPDGKYIRLYNSEIKEMEIGNHILQQNCKGEPIIIFRFPPQAKFPRNSIMTVWAASVQADMFPQSTLDYLFKDQRSWVTESDVTTILCNPKGQAIAWTNPFVKSPGMKLITNVNENTPTVTESQTTEPEMNRIISKKVIKDTTSNKSEKTSCKINHVKFPYGCPPGHKCHPCSDLNSKKVGKYYPPAARNSSIFSLASKYRIKNTAMVDFVNTEAQKHDGKTKKSENFLTVET